MSKEIDGWAKEISEWRATLDFYTPWSLDTIQERDAMLGKLMLVVTEVAEAAEAVRHNDLPNFKEEIADTFIRLLDICGTMGFNIETIIRDKMAVNALRPRRHGKETSL